MEPKTILVVDDDAAVLRLVSQVLIRDGHTVIAAAGPQQAAATFAGEHANVALVVCDVVMPGMSGPDLIQQFVAAKPNVRVLFITGFAHAEALRRGITGENPVLYKPFTPRELVAKVRELLGDSQAAASGAL